MLFLLAFFSFLNRPPFHIVCRHKRLFLLQGARKEDSGAPDRQRGSARAARRAKRAGCRIETAGTTGHGSAGGRRWTCGGKPARRFTAADGSSVPDKLRLPRRVGVEKREEDTEEVARKMASCLISANQDERKTTPKLAVSWSAVERRSPVCVCVCVVCVCVCVCVSGCVACWCVCVCVFEAVCM